MQFEDLKRQFDITYIVGVPMEQCLNDLDLFCKKLVETASALCGGCTTSTATGYWKEDGASHSSTFSGALHAEHAFVLSLTTEEHKLSRVLQAMQENCASFADVYNIDTNWVHVKVQESRAAHFSVQGEILARLVEEAD